ncbi:MAG: ACT domain-containing protein [Mailhella sp.]|nr:ACT domain-containing protein [Mailhella sp.]
MTVDQISVFVQNRAGQLGDVTRALRDAQVNIRAMSLSDTTDFGVLRLMVDNAVRAQSALQAAGFTAGTTPVIAAELPDRPGGLDGVLALLAGKGINVEYLYGYTQRSSSEATLVFRFDRMDEAENLLKENGIRVLSAADLG